MGARRLVSGPHLSASPTHKSFAQASVPYFIFPTMASSPFIVTKHLVDAQYIREYPHATSTQDAPLKLAVKKYTPVDNQNPTPGDVTLIGVTGTGIPKVSRKK